MPHDVGAAITVEIADDHLLLLVGMVEADILATTRITDRPSHAADNLASLEQNDGKGGVGTRVALIGPGGPSSGIQAADSRGVDDIVRPIAIEVTDIRVSRARAEPNGREAIRVSDYRSAGWRT